MNKYIEHLQEKENRVKESNAKYFDSISTKLPEVLDHIADRFSEIKKVIVFGSFTDGSFNTNSDIDLYIQGLDPTNYYEAKRFIEDSLSIDIDLYTDTDNNDFINNVKSRGVIIYDR